MFSEADIVVMIKSKCISCAGYMREEHDQTIQEAT